MRVNNSSRQVLNCASDSPIILCIWAVLDSLKTNYIAVRRAIMTQQRYKCIPKPVEHLVIVLVNRTRENISTIS